MKQEIQDLIDKLAIVEEAIEEAEDHAMEVDAVATKEDREVIAGILKQLKGLDDRVKYIAGALDPIIVRYTNRDDSVVLVPGGGSVEVTRSKPRKKWEHDKVASVVAERILDSVIDPESGAVTVPPSQLIIEILKYCHVDYWRVTDLKEIDINADLYCQLSEGTTSIIVR